MASFGALNLFLGYNCYGTSHEVLERSHRGHIAISAGRERVGWLASSSSLNLFFLGQNCYGTFCQVLEQSPRGHITIFAGRESGLAAWPLLVFSCFSRSKLLWDLLPSAREKI